MADKKDKISLLRIAYKFVGLIFPILYLLFNRMIVLLFTLFILILYLSYDTLRMKNKRFNKLIIKNAPFLVKDKERAGISSAIWLLLGVFIIIFFFSKEIVLISLVIFTFGDAAGSILGKRFHKIKIFDKSLEGNLFVFLFSFIAASIVAYSIGFSIYRVLLGSLAATIIQAFPIKLDDNLTMPIVAAIVMSIT